MLMLLGLSLLLDSLVGFPVFIITVDDGVFAECLFSEIFATVENFSLFCLRDLFGNAVFNKDFFGSLSLSFSLLLNLFKILFTFLFKQGFFILIFILLMIE